MPPPKQINTDQNPNLLTDEQVALELHTCVRTVRNWRVKKGLPFLKLSGRFTLTRRTDLDKWLSQFSVNALN